MSPALAGVHDVTPAIAPDILTFDELVVLSDTDRPPAPLAEKVERLLTTPFVDNEASIANVEPHRPVVQGIGPVVRVVSWNIERGLNFDLIRLAFSDPEGFRKIALERGKPWQEQIDLELRTLQDADIILLNEVDLGMKRTDYRDVARDLARALKMNYAFGVDACVERGYVRTIGCSNLAAWQIMKSLGISERRGFARFETVQSYYSIAGRDLEREVLPLVEDQGLGVMVWSPLAGGFLSGKFTREGSKSNDARRAVFDFPPVDKEKAYDIIDVMKAVGDRHGVSVARVALAWLLQRKGVMSVIVGAKTIEQLDDNLAAAKTELTAEDVAELDKVSALTPEYPGWMIARQADGRVPAAKG